MKWILYSGGTVVLLIVVILVWGALLPVDHVASSSVHLNATPDEVWESITNLTAFPEWRDDVERVEVPQDTTGLPRWKEFGANGALTFAVRESEPPRRFVTEITDKELPFGGTWTFDIIPDGDGSKVTITEDGEVYNIIFRFVARYLIGHTATMGAYLANLSRRHGSSE